LITKVKRPSVISISGLNINFKTGLRKTFTNAKIKASFKRGTNSNKNPGYVIKKTPGISHVAARIAKALAII